MKTYYCWRCRTKIPMLDESEWKELAPLFSNMILRIKAYRQKHNCELKTAKAAIEREACEKYKELTGFEETNYLALYHHRLSLYGPECKACGNLFRTPEASYCANCGLKASDNI